jgi:signal transduction histidine kinase
MKEIQAPINTTKSPRVRNLIAFSSLIMLLFCVIVAYQSSQAYEQAIREGKQDAERLTRVISDHVELTFLTVDSTLHRAVERQYYNNMFGGNLPEDMMHNLQMWVDQTPQIAAMILIDENGQGVVAAHKKGYVNWMDYSKKSFAEEDVFKKMKEADDSGYYIGKLPKSAVRAQDLIIVSRRISKLDGTFGGIFIAAIDPHYFIDFFQTVDMGKKRYMSLGLSRFPITLVDGPENGEEYAKVRQTMYQEIDSFGVNTKIRSGTKTIDKSIKIYAYKGIKKLPLMVGVVMDEEDFLAGWRAARIKDAGFLAIFTVFGSVLSFFALTMARQIQRVEESESAAVLASQAKSEFLANMSHELRTPLNAINGFSEMLGSGYFGPLNPKQKERIHDINLCGGHLLQLITDILDFSKGDAGKLELVEEKVVVQDMVDETIRMMHEKLKSKHINLVTDVDMDLPKLFGDKRKIRQMLLNLLSNSIKFTPEEGTVKLAVRLDQFNNMILTVSDTGIGMAEDDIPVALSVFGQVHRSHNHEGTGLGLPLCKMFAELHGGKLAIGSTIGQGTTVRITFPQNRVLVNDEDSYEEQDNTLKLNISQRS